MVAATRTVCLNVSFLVLDGVGGPTTRVGADKDKVHLSAGQRPSHVC
jgi:hypothetical protein